VHQGKDRDLQWRSGDTQVFHRPAQEMIQVGVGILFTGKAEDEFVEMACGNIAAMVPPQGKMSLEQFCILEKIEAGGGAWRMIEKAKPGVGFKFVDKALLALQRSLGDGGKATEFVAVQRDEFIGLAIACNIN